MISDKDATYILNNTGPRTEPWGTPYRVKSMQRLYLGFEPSVASPGGKIGTISKQCLLYQLYALGLTAVYQEQEFQWSDSFYSQIGCDNAGCFWSYALSGVYEQPFQLVWRRIENLLLACSCSSSLHLDQPFSVLVLL